MCIWVTAEDGARGPAAALRGAVLLDVGCGGGLLAPRLTGAGYRHVGVDLSPSAVGIARRHGVQYVLRGDAHTLPVADETADVVAAGEIPEHVTDLRAVVAECCRVLRPGGTLVLDTLADTWLARVLAISVAEPLAGRRPPGPAQPA